MNADQLALKASELISGWQRRYVPYEAWSEAYDCLCDMGMYDLNRANEALERFMEHYAKWVSIWGEPTPTE